MAEGGSHPLVDELKVRASLLMKGLASSDGGVALAAARRFERLPEFSELDAAAIRERREQIQRRHALAVMAAEMTYPSWQELTMHVAALEPVPSARLATAFSRRFYPIRGPLSMKEWFASYASASRMHRDSEGFLFPYERQFFICDAAFVKTELRMDPTDSAWALIGRDWVRPRNLAAWRRLNARAPVPRSESDGLPARMPRPALDLIP